MVVYCSTSSALYGIGSTAYSRSNPGSPTKNDLRKRVVFFVYDPLCGGSWFGVALRASVVVATMP